MHVFHSLAVVFEHVCLSVKDLTPPPGGREAESARPLSEDARDEEAQAEAVAAGPPAGVRGAQSERRRHARGGDAQDRLLGHRRLAGQDVRGAPTELSRRADRRNIVIFFSQDT